MRWLRSSFVAGLTALLVAGAWAPLAHAKTITIADEFGISYLPLTIMHARKILEKLGMKANVPITTTWRQFSGGAAMDEALISGNVDIGAGGIPPMIVLWSRTRETPLHVHAIASLGSMPIFLNTIDANVHSIKDFTSKDRIAMPAAGVSTQAITLMMEAAKVFGPTHAKQLNPITVSMSHPDGMAALLTRKSGITAHFTSPPYQYEELTHKGVHRVLDSYDVLGGPTSFNVAFATGPFMKKNPKLDALFIEALRKADQFIIDHPKQAAAIYIHATHSALSEPELVKMLKNPEIKWTVMPEKVMPYARFMVKIGLIPKAPTGLDELFFSKITK